MFVKSGNRLKDWTPDIEIEAPAVFVRSQKKFPQSRIDTSHARPQTDREPA